MKEYIKRMVEQCEDLEIFPLLSKKDMAKRWGVSKEVVRNWANRHEDFPESIQTVNSITVNNGPDRKTELYPLCNVKEYERRRGLKLV